MIEFEPWDKIPRLYRDIVVTEKIDGTNAAVIITPDGGFGAQSRKRLITPEDDNYGFARWAHANREALTEVLGPGRHFGEWWGSGIGRKYGLDEKRFSLFNTKRWGLLAKESPIPELSVVPVIYNGVFGQIHLYQSGIEWALEHLQECGSRAAPGFMNPEGIVVYHSAANMMFKATLENDEEWKGNGRDGHTTRSLCRAGSPA